MMQLLNTHKLLGNKQYNDKKEHRSYAFVNQELWEHTDLCEALCNKKTLWLILETYFARSFLF